MRIPNLGETELLVPLHEGVFERPLWSGFLERLRAIADSAVAAILLRAGEARSLVELSSASDARGPALRHYFDSLDLEPLREGRVYSQEELGAPATPSAKHWPFLRAIKVRVEGGLEAWMVLAAPDEIDASASALLTALAPHLRVALRVLDALERESARATMNAGAFSHIDFGWIAIDAKCRVVDADPQAQRFMRRSGALRVGPYGRLAPSVPAIDRQLTQLVKDFARDPAARPRAINLSQDPWIDILISPVRISALAAGGEAVAVVYFRGEQSSSADRCQQLVDVFDLTQSEARFAWSIAQGLSIAEAAGRNGLTIETARNYSKKIYSKTGAKGQVDFMRRVLTSVVALTVH